MNKVILIGRLGKDPESKDTKSGVALTTFSLATSKKIKGQKVTQWHNVTLFNKTAEIAAQYLSKGSQVMIEGEINYDSYDKDGETKYFTKIIGNQIELLGGGNQSDSDAQERKPVTFDNDDIPF